MIFQIIIYPLARFPELAGGRTIKLAKGQLFLLLVSVALVIAWAVNYLLWQAGAQLLQIFYYLVYGLGLSFSIVLLLSDLRWRYLALSGLALGFAIIIILGNASAILQNIIMALSLVWVGPLVFKKFELRPRYFLAVLLAFAAVDACNVYIGPGAKPAVSDDGLLFNGLVASGSYLLGMGDFLLAGLAVCFVFKYLGRQRAVWLAVLLAAVRFLLRWLWPAYTADIPYAAVIALITILCSGTLFLRSTQT